MKKALWQKREAGVLEKNAAGEGDASEASAAPAEPAVPADSDAVGPKVDDGHEGEEEEPMAQDGEVEDVERCAADIAAVTHT